MGSLRNMTLKPWFSTLAAHLNHPGRLTTMSVPKKYNRPMATDCLTVETQISLFFKILLPSFQNTVKIENHCCNFLFRNLLRSLGSLHLSKATSHTPLISYSDQELFEASVASQKIFIYTWSGRRKACLSVVGRVIIWVW